MIYRKLLVAHIRRYSVESYPVDTSSVRQSSLIIRYYQTPIKTPKSAPLITISATHSTHPITSHHCPTTHHIASLSQPLIHQKQIATHPHPAPPQPYHKQQTLFVPSHHRAGCVQSPVTVRAPSHLISNPITLLTSLHGWRSDE